VPYSKLKDANPAIQGIKPSVTLAQANLVAKWADAMETAKDGPESPWAAAIAQFKKLYTVEGDKWVKKESKKAVSLDEQGRRVRDAWYANFRPPRGTPIAQPESLWVKEVFGESIIIESSEGLFYEFNYIAVYIDNLFSLYLIFNFARNVLIHIIA